MPSAVLCQVVLGQSKPSDNIIPSLAQPNSHSGLVENEVLWFLDAQACRFSKIRCLVGAKVELRREYREIGSDNSITGLLN